jgi:hypothetical protein
MILIPFSKCVFSCWLSPPSHLTYTPTKSNLYFDSSFDTVTGEPALNKRLTFKVQSHIHILLLTSFIPRIHPRPTICVNFLTVLFVMVRGCWPQAGRSLLAVCARLLIQCICMAGSQPSIYNPRTRLTCLCSQHTLKKYIEHSFSVTLMYYKSSTASNNIKVSIYYYLWYFDKTNAAPLPSETSRLFCVTKCIGWQ